MRCSLFSCNSHSSTLQGCALSFVALIDEKARHSRPCRGIMSTWTASFGQKTCVASTSTSFTLDSRSLLLIKTICL